MINVRVAQAVVTVEDHEIDSQGLICRTYDKCRKCTRDSVLNATYVILSNCRTKDRDCSFRTLLRLELSPFLDEVPERRRLA